MPRDLDHGIFEKDDHQYHWELVREGDSGACYQVRRLGELVVTLPHRKNETSKDRDARFVDVLDNRDELRAAHSLGAIIDILYGALIGYALFLLGESSVQIGSFLQAKLHNSMALELVDVPAIAIASAVAILAITAYLMVDVSDVYLRNHQMPFRTASRYIIEVGIIGCYVLALVLAKAGNVFFSTPFVLAVMLGGYWSFELAREYPTLDGSLRPDILRESNLQFRVSLVGHVFFWGVTTVTLVLAGFVVTLHIVVAVAAVIWSVWAMLYIQDGLTRERSNPLSILKLSLSTLRGFLRWALINDRAPRRTVK